MPGPHRVGATEQQPKSCRELCARGRELHSTVPAHRWCVTRDDLDHFVDTVQEWHRRGDIPNDPDPVTGLPNPHHDDPKIGPNLHMVNKYVISPVTLASGGMSWALMLREEGLPIDFFITHSWQEGIYEFHKKVSESWPPGVRHAWCCFLANPQPWDRDDLKELMGSNPDLSDSPFAEALGAPSCQMLLAVPNVTESVYARLWCVEEARRAITAGLPVWVATDRGILHWPLGCKNIQEASDILSSGRLHRSRAWCEEDVYAKEHAQDQLAARFRTVLRARCSDPDDEKRILASISGREREIDGVIRRLATQGHWLPAWRHEECGGGLRTPPSTTSSACSTQPGSLSPGVPAVLPSWNAGDSPCSSGPCRSHLLDSPIRRPRQRCASLERTSDANPFRVPLERPLPRTHCVDDGDERAVARRQTC